jgi:FkbM family methyltransferase
MGTYERANQELLLTLLAEGDVFLDLGANVGFFTLLAARAVGPDGQVLAVEPLPRNVVHLERHLSLNKIQNVRVMCGAVSDRANWVPFLTGDTVSSGKVGTAASLMVWADRVDVLCQSLSRAPTVVKMDVEGAEGAALRGMNELLATVRPVLHLSSHGDASYRDCMALLEELGYRHIDSPLCLPHPTFGVLKESLCVPAERYAQVEELAAPWLIEEAPARRARSG